MKYHMVKTEKKWDHMLNAFIYYFVVLGRRPRQYKNLRFNPQVTLIETQ